MNKNQLSRRNFLGKSALIGAASVAGISALSSCAKKTKEVDYEFPPLLDPLHRKLHNLDKPEQLICDPYRR